MSKFFVPYSGQSPAAVEINGHRILIVATTPDPIEDELGQLGGDKLMELDFASADGDELSELALEIKGGVVVAPPGVDLSTMLHSLEQELPWVH